MIKQFDFMFSANVFRKGLEEDSDTSQIQLEGYKCIPQGRSSSTKGGLIIYLHENSNDYKFKLTGYDTWEGQFIQVKKNATLSKPIIIGNIYRQPRKNLEHYDVFINEFSSILNKFESDRNEVLIAGDFNINLHEINNKHIISEYFEMLTNHSFYPKITLRTRLSNKHGTLIDKILCKLSEITLDTTSGVLYQTNLRPSTIFCHLE